MNISMTSRWSAISKLIETTKLEPKLSGLSDDEIVIRDGAVLLKPLISDGINLDQFEDATRFEAITNKIHIKDYLDENCSLEYVLIQGIKYSCHLKERLSHIGKTFRIILSLDPDSDEVTVRFFVKRPGEPYGCDDPNEYKLEEVAYWDIH